MRTLVALVAILAAVRTGPLAQGVTPPGTEIVNVATCEGLSSPEPSSAFEVSSNAVVTRVAAPVCIRSPVLEVSPAGTIAPGTRLTYMLTAANTAREALTESVFEMILDAGLGDPIRYTDNAASASNGTRVPVTGAFDPARRAVTWSVENLAPGQEIRLELVAPVRDDVAPDALIAQTAEARSALCPEPVRSNTVASPVVPPILAVTARADREAAAPGDAVVYTIEIAHEGAAPDLTQVDLIQVVPAGLRYVAGTARLDGARIADPPRSAPAGAARTRSSARADGGALRFSLGPLPPRARRTLRLATIVGPHGTRGEAPARTRAEARTAAGFLLASSTASVVVTIVPGPFRQEALLVGRVFVDDDGDGAPGAGEPGVPGALVMLEDGRGAVTDITGRWHVEGVRPGLHVVRVDPSTLPPPLAPRSGGAEWAGATTTRFIEARAATLVVSDLPVGPPGTARCTIAAGSVRIDLPAASLLRPSGEILPGAEAHVQGAANLIADRGEASSDPGVSCQGTAFDSIPACRELEGRLRRLLAPHAAPAAEAAGSAEETRLDASRPEESTPEASRADASRPVASGPLSGAGALDSATTRNAPGAASVDSSITRSTPGTVPLNPATTGPGPGAGSLDSATTGPAPNPVVSALAAAGPAAGFLGSRSAPAVRPDPLEQVVQTAAPIAAIVTPVDGSRARRSSINVEVVYPADARPELRVNSRLVPDTLIGTTTVLPRRGVRAARYVGVPLEPGRNRIVFSAQAAGADPATRAESAVSAVTVTLPGSPVELRLDAPEGRWRADGVTPPALRIEAVDGSGVRTTEDLMVTLLIEGARPLGEDLDPRTEGFQARLEEGAAILRIAPLTSPGRVHVLATSGTIERETDIDVDPAGGPWRVTGLVEGHVAGEGGVQGDGGVPPGVVDSISEDGGRVALFARGGVGQASQITLALDTDRTRDRDRLFQRFEPDLFYPVTGDAGIETAQAESQSKLFARLDGPAGFAQLGDFATGFDRTELARYDRRMTGLSGRSRFGRFILDGFAASTDQITVRDVFAPDGTSGPYRLSKRPVVARSETVIVEVRDRYRTDETISRQIRHRDLDYSLDPIAGTLLFRGPVAPFDRDLNPVRVVVLYETRSGGGQQTTAGGRLAFAGGGGFEAGATAVRDEREGADLTMLGVDMTWRPLPGTALQVETARTDEGSDAESAVRIGIASRSGPTLGWELSYRDIPEGFANPTYLGSPELGSRRASGSVLWNPTERWRIKGEAFTQNDERTRLERSIAGVEAERRYGEATVTARVQSAVSESPTLGSASTTVVGAGVRAPLARKLTGELAHQQALGSESVPGYPTRTTAGLSYELRAGTRAFLVQEIDSGADTNRNHTVLGVESQIGRSTKALTRYTLEEGASGSALRANTGVETVLAVGPDSHASFSAARLDTTRGDDRGDFTSLAGGYERRAGASLFSSRYEVSLGQLETRHMLTASGAIRLRDPWTLFVRERFFLSRPEGASSASRLEGLLGAAYRPLVGRWQLLARLDHVLAASRPAAAGGILPGGALSEPSAAADTPAPATAQPGLGLGPGQEAGRDSVALSLAAGIRLAARHRLAATWVGRYVESDGSAGLPSTFTQLVSLHETVEVHPRWIVGASVRRFAQSETKTAVYGAGAEVGFLLLKNLRLIGGYNVAGFSTRDMPGRERTDRGAFLSMQLKFDEQSLAHPGDLRLDRPE